MTHFSFRVLNILSQFLEQSINDGDTFGIMRPFNSLIVVLVSLFIFCYFGDGVTTRFHDVNDLMYECSWRLLPVNLRKELPMILAAAQNPAHLRGFANLNCSCEVFKKVNKTQQHVQLKEYSIFLFRF